MTSGQYEQWKEEYGTWYQVMLYSEIMTYKWSLANYPIAGQPGAEEVIWDIE